MNKWQARKAHQELATDINSLLDTPKRVEPLPHIGVHFTLLVRHEIWSQIATQIQKAVK